MAASPEDAPLHLMRLANEPFKQDQRDVPAWNCRKLNDMASSQPANLEMAKREFNNQQMLPPQPGQPQPAMQQQQQVQRKKEEE